MPSLKDFRTNNDEKKQEIKAKKFHAQPKYNLDQIKRDLPKQKQSSSVVYNSYNELDQQQSAKYYSNEPIESHQEDYYVI